MILAGIDVGTNTFRLLVADTGPDSFHEIHAERKVVRLGQDLDLNGMFAREAEDRALKTLGDFAGKIRFHAALHTAAVGTSALRNASNSSAFIQAVKKQTDITITVVSGEEEARLTLLGVAWALAGGRRPRQIKPFGPALVIDIGGGSTEIIAAKGDEKPVCASVPLGALYLTERCIKHDPPVAEELELLRRIVRKELDRHAAMLRMDPAGILIGTAGTITTLAAMDLKLANYDPGKVNGHTLTRETVNSLVKKLEAGTIAERRTLPGLEKGREDIILAGAVIAQEIMERFGMKTIVVSDGGLREGIVLDLYEKVQFLGV